MKVPLVLGVKQGVADEFRYRLDLEVVLMLSKRSPGPKPWGFHVRRCSPLWMTFKPNEYIIESLNIFVLK